MVAEPVMGAVGADELVHLGRHHLGDEGLGQDGPADDRQVAGRQQVAPVDRVGVVEARRVEQYRVIGQPQHRSPLLELA